MHLCSTMFSYDCHLGVCNSLTLAAAGAKDVLRHFPANREQELCLVHKIAYARMTLM